MSWRETGTILAADRLESIELYNQAMELYLNRRWQEALPIFQEALRKSGGADPASGLMAERCTEYIATPPQKTGMVSMPFIQNELRCHHCG